LAAFTGLVATAIANAQARDDLHRLVDEQSALRRVATAVAGAAGPEQVFDLVCRETGRLFGADTVNLVHFTPDGVNLTMGRRRGGALPVPGRPLCVGSCRRPGRRVGYLLKDRVGDLPTFVEAVRRVADGGSWLDPLVVQRMVGRRRAAGPMDRLTGREREVLGLIAEGGGVRWSV
jgi:GAF domain-containing protein